MGEMESLRDDGGREGGGREGEGGVDDGPKPLLESHPVLAKLAKWDAYASVGRRLHNTRFIPCKTPLSQSLLAKGTFKDRFSVAALYDAVGAIADEERAAVGGTSPSSDSGEDGLGLLIDLSNHSSLYLSDLPSLKNVEYKQVRNVAKQIPRSESVKEVIEIVREFWRRRPQAYVAIHCSYGFNRTGFVLCCYLVEECGLSCDEALSHFAKSRKPGVKHQSFIHGLHLRYPSLYRSLVVADDSGQNSTISESDGEDSDRE